MTDAGQTVCLCMIVKNEAHVLRRCLESVEPLIDCWLIVDTGSTDGTQELVRDFFKGIPGTLLERPWKDFGFNRSESISFARGKADFVLTLDADEYLRTDTKFCWPQLTHDAYDFLVDSGGVTYRRIQLVRSALPWRYGGVLHEHITCDQAYTQALMPRPVTVRLLEGARSRDPLTYRRDALLLEEALQTDPDNSRTMFYLAQSYRDAHEPELAMDRYGKRARMAGFAEEVWCSLYEIAKLMQQTGVEWPAVQEAYLNAYRYRPWRAEPLYRIGLHYLQRKDYTEAKRYLEQAITIQLPTDDVLFVEADVYHYLLPLEYAVACYWLGLHDEAIAVTDRVLARTDVSPERRELLLRNRQCSLDALHRDDGTGCHAF